MCLNFLIALADTDAPNMGPSVTDDGYLTTNYGELLSVSILGYSLLVWVAKCISA